MTGWKGVLVSVAVLSALGCILILLLGQRDQPAALPAPVAGTAGPETITAEEILALQAASTEELVANLSSSSNDLVLNSLGVLRRRSEPEGRDKAQELLGSDEPYVWFNAAQYLGALGDPVAVPHLIRGLGHPAFRAHDRVAQMLRSITGQSYGADQQAWVEWWEAEHPRSDFDFSQ